MGRIIGMALVLGALAGLAAQHPTAAGYVALARSAEAQGAWNRALVWYHEAADLAPDDPTPPLASAQIRYQQGRYALAAALVRRATALAPADAAVWLLTGQIAAAQGQPDDAARAWRRASTLAPADAAQHAVTLLVTHDLAAGQPEQALRDAAAVAQPSAAVRLAQAVAWLHLGQAATALTIFATLPAATHTAAYLAVARGWQGTAADEAALGYADLAQGWPRLASAPLRAALAAQPRYGVGAAYLAWALWGSGDATGAQRMLAQAVRLAPDAAVTVGLAALLQAQQGDPAGAVRTLSAWLHQHTPTPALWHIMAAIAVPAGDLAAEAAARWQIATTAAPADRLVAWLALGRFYVQTRLGRDDGRAAWVFARLRAAAPQNAAAADVAAQWAWQNGQPTAALALAQLALARAPADVTAHANLAAWAAALGDTTEAALQAARVADLTGTT